VYGHWFRHTLKIVEANPFADVEPPRYDKPVPRYIEGKEQEALFKWIMGKWGWRLPILFLETKAAIGCRIGELSAALTCNLQNGRLYFTADTTKGRESRACLLPAALYQELQATAGPAETVDSGRSQGVLRYHQSPSVQAPQLPGNGHVEGPPRGDQLRRCRRGVRL
jgi:hypothetical protein